MVHEGVLFVYTEPMFLITSKQLSLTFPPPIQQQSPPSLHMTMPLLLHSQPSCTYLHLPVLDSFSEAETRWKNRQKEVFWKWEEIEGDAQVGHRFARGSFRLKRGSGGLLVTRLTAIQGQVGLVSHKQHPHFPRCCSFIPAQREEEPQKGAVEGVKGFSVYLAQKGISTCPRRMDSIMERMVTALFVLVLNEFIAYFAFCIHLRNRIINL